MQGLRPGDGPHDGICPLKSVQYCSLFLLALQLSLECALAVGDPGLITGWIDEGIAVSSFEAGILGGEPEVGSMRAQENVAGQGVEHLKAVPVVLGDARIGLVADEFVAGVHVGAADDYYVESAARFGFVHCPGCGSLGVAWGEVGGEDGAAEAHDVAVVEDAVDMCWREVHGGICAVVEVRFAAGLDYGDIGVHDVILGSGEFQNRGAAGAVVIVGVTDEQYFDIAEFKAEGLDVLGDGGDRGLKAAVDEDVALRRDEEIGGEIFAADVIEVTGDAEGREGIGPGGNRGGGDVDRRGEEDGDAEESAKFQWSSAAEI